MDHRLYFIMGDLVANFFIGAVVALFCWMLVGIDWNMFVAMVVMMVLGMIISLPISLPFVIFFGAMEVMIPGMLTGMLSGMFVGMRLTTTSSSLADTLIYGGLIGEATIAGIWIINSLLRGNRRVD